MQQSQLDEQRRVIERLLGELDALRALVSAAQR
jgi:hypothetical protein